METFFPLKEDVMEQFPDMKELFDPEALLSRLLGYHVAALRQNLSDIE